MLYKLIDFHNNLDDVIGKLKPWDLIEDYMGYNNHERKADRIAIKLGATKKKYFFCDEEHKDLFSVHYFKNTDVVDSCYTQIMSYHRLINCITYQKELRFHIDIAHDKYHGGFIDLLED